MSYRDAETRRQQRYWENQRQRRNPSDPVVEAFARPKVEFIARHLSLRASPLILDVGCGNGYFTHYLTALGQTIGLDLSRGMLRMNPSPRLLQGSATALPIADRRFDLVFCSNLLHHLPAPLEAVAEMARASRRYVVLSEPNRNNPLMLALGLVKRSERMSLRFTRAYVRKLMEGSGLRVLACETMGFATPNRLPRPLALALGRFNSPNPLGAYSVVVAERRD